MKLETKFDVGDRVYFVVETERDRICDFCGGKGFLVVYGLTNKLMNATCPKCKGNGVIITEFAVSSSKIGGIEASTHETYGTNVNYLVKGNKYGYVKYKESELYATAEEAQSEADRRNA